jgi:hypothetical protein
VTERRVLSRDLRASGEVDARGCNTVFTICKPS